MVFAKAGLSAEPMVPDGHAAGGGLGHPEVGFGRRLGGVAPPGLAGGPGAGDCGDRAAVHPATGDAALLSAGPCRRVVAAAALVVGIKPLGNLSHFVEVDHGTGAAAEVAEE